VLEFIYIFTPVKFLPGLQLILECMLFYMASICYAQGQFYFYFHFTTSIKGEVKAKLPCAFLLK